MQFYYTACGVNDCLTSTILGQAVVKSYWIADAFSRVIQADVTMRHSVSVTATGRMLLLRLQCDVSGDPANHRATY